MNAASVLAESICRLYETVRSNLSNEKIEFWQELVVASANLLADSMAGGTDEEANKSWFINAAANAHHGYLVSFHRMRDGDYYRGWCELESVEISLLALQENTFYEFKSLGLDTLKSMVANWQSLFPYAVFISPEFAIRREECTICGQAVHPWSNCEHDVGRVYRGRQCGRIVREAEFLGVSLVSEPVQRYSVVFATNAEGERYDHYDYSIVRFVVDRLRSPYSIWRPTRTLAYHPHSLFADRDPQQGCPCGSGRAYAGCCKSRRGVIRPHIDIEFNEQPDPELPSVLLPDYSEHIALEKTSAPIHTVAVGKPAG